MKNMIELKNIIGEKRAADLKSLFPKCMQYVENYYCIDEEKDVYEFNLEKNDNVYTKSSVNDYADKHMCHILTHINPSKQWAIDKIKTMFDYKKGLTDDRNGTFEPTWFTSRESFSLLLEELFISSKNRDKLVELERWLNDRDIYYYDRRNNRFCFNVEFNKVTGYGIVANTDYDTLFECHAVRFVCEYTISHEDGEFVFYDAYPVYTAKDRVTINNARAEFRRRK